MFVRLGKEEGGMKTNPPICKICSKPEVCIIGNYWQCETKHDEPVKIYNETKILVGGYWFEFVNPEYGVFEVSDHSSKDVDAIFVHKPSGKLSEKYRFGKIPWGTAGKSVWYGFVNEKTNKWAFTSKLINSDRPTCKITGNFV